MTGVCGGHKRRRTPWLLATMWVLGIELGSSGKAASALNHLCSPASVT